jgi:hypothetical protein
MEKLKQRWGIDSNFQILIIFLVFAINGSLAVYITNPVTDFIGISKETTNPLFYWPVRILVIFIVYQVTLVIVGTIFGQKKFFWNMEKKMLRRMGLGRFLN